MPNWVWCTAKPKDDEPGNSLNSFLIRLGVQPSSGMLVLISCQTHVCLGLTHSQFQERWVSQLVRPAPCQTWHATRSKGVGFSSSATSYQLELNTLSNLRAVSLVTCQAHFCLALAHSRAQERWVWKLTTHVSNWARHAAMLKGAEFGSSLTSCPIKLGTQPGPGMLDLLTCHTYTHVDSDHNHVQEYWVQKRARLVSFEPNILSNLGILGMDTTPTHLSICYHFRLSILGLRFFLINCHKKIHLSLTLISSLSFIFYKPVEAKRTTTYALLKEMYIISRSHFIQKDANKI